MEELKYIGKEMHQSRDEPQNQTEIGCQVSLYTSKEGEELPYKT